MIPAENEKPDNTSTLRQMGHDIRGPLHVIKGLTEILTSSQSLSANEKNIVRMLKSNADQLNTLVENMINYAQAQEDASVKPAQARIREARLPLQDFTPGRKKRVLLVEDHAATAHVAEAFLQHLECICDIAESGQEALNKFSASRYDLILMDVQMRGMDGIETTRRIRALEKENNAVPTPIIAATGNATEDDHLICRRAGMNACLSKPFSVADLEDILHVFSKPNA